VENIIVAESTNLLSSLIEIKNLQLDKKSNPSVNRTHLVAETIHYKNSKGKSGNA
jgi:hypothetical protein